MWEMLCHSVLLLLLHFVILHIHLKTVSSGFPMANVCHNASIVVLIISIVVFKCGGICVPCVGSGVVRIDCSISWPDVVKGN